MATELQCPVCGFPGLAEEPRTHEGGGSFEICPSCGFQFGVSDDSDGIDYIQWRDTWIANGMKWWSDSHHPPPDWNPKKQLRSVE